MTREKIEEQIAAVSKDIDIYNRKIAEIVDLVRERDRLRQKLDELLSQLCLAKAPETEPELKPLFIYKGKTKDLLEALQSEIQKAQ